MLFYYLDLAGVAVFAVSGVLAAREEHPAVAAALVKRAGFDVVGVLLLAVLLRQRDVERIDAGDAVPVPA